MAKITRKTQKIFAETAGATGITEYGSPAGGSPVYSTDLDNIQTAAWLTGWSAAALAGSEIPTFQDFNAIHYTVSSQLGYVLQEGVAEYDAATDYYQNSIVKKTGTYELYGSLINANTGNALPSQVDDANWKYLGNLTDIATGTTPTDNVVAVTSAANAATIDLALADPFNAAFSHTFTENTTFTFTNPKATGFNSGFKLFLTNAAGAYTPTFPVSVIWSGGSEPDLTTANEKNVLVFETIDGGTTWYGALSIGAAA